MASKCDPILNTIKVEHFFELYIKAMIADTANLGVSGPGPGVRVGVGVERLGLAISSPAERTRSGIHKSVLVFARPLEDSNPKNRMLALTLFTLT